MNTLTSKLLGVVSVVLLLVSAVAGIVVFATGEYIDFLLIWTYVLVITAFVIIILASLIGMLSSKKSALSLLTVLAIAAVIVFTCRAFAPASLPTFFGVEEYHLTIASSQWIDTALYVTYTLFFVSILGLLFTAIRSAATK